MSMEVRDGTDGHAVSLDSREEIWGEASEDAGRTGSSWRDYLLLIISLLLIALGLIFGLSGTS